MAIQAGNFTASDLAQSIVSADRMWSDDMLKADYEAEVDVVKALRKEQNAKVDVLKDPEKDREIKVHWINTCNNVAEDCDDDDCDLAGDELGSDSKTYGITQCKQYKFTVDEMVWRTNDYNMSQAVARGFLEADKVLSEAVATSAVAKLEAWKGTNTVSNGVGTPNVATTETDVAPADWNERLFAYLYRVAIMNKFKNPFVISGSNLFEDRIVSLLAESNANGKGAAKLFKLMRTYFDLFNIDTVNDPDLKTYMLARGAVAFAHKNYYAAQPTVYKSQDRYSVASRNLSNVRLDVYYTNRCSANTMKHDFKVKINYDWFLNPLGCDTTRTGVLAFNNAVPE